MKKSKSCQKMNKTNSHLKRIKRTPIIRFVRSTAGSNLVQRAIVRSSNLGPNQQHFLQHLEPIKQVKKYKGIVMHSSTKISQQKVPQKQQKTPFSQSNLVPPMLLSTASTQLSASSATLKSWSIKILFHTPSELC